MSDLVASGYEVGLGRRRFFREALFKYASSYQEDKGLLTSQFLVRAEPYVIGALDRLIRDWQAYDRLVEQVVEDLAEERRLAKRWWKPWTWLD